MSNNIFDILGGKETAKSLPAESGVFASSGFVGQGRAYRLQRFWSAEDVAEYELPYEEFVDYNRRGKERSWWYYFQDAEAADIAYKEVGGQYNTDRVLRFELVTATVKNLRGDNWGQTIGADAVISILTWKTTRHQFHMFALPALVQALATVAGKIDERHWHVDEILDGIRDEDYTDNLEFTLIGDAEANTDDVALFDQVLQACDGDIDLAQKVCLGLVDTPPESVAHLAGKVRIHYTRSKLWLRREALWKSLGEPNAQAYIPIGYAETDYAKEFETTSKDLSELLRFSVEEWKQPLWMRLHIVDDPRMDSVYGDNKRPWLPVVTDIYLTEEEAEAAVDDEITNNQKDAKPQQQGNDRARRGPPVPETWGEDARDDWVEMFSDQKNRSGHADANVNDVPMPVIIKLARTLSATPEDIKIWWQVE
ncbi:hypothetical protein GF380_04250 [Candidatus Uhrbacteria bacterium]|nr:hypothetical protein [Candidatus Uhrbacteria bacterium]